MMKGALRTKHGCWTCRVRKKKCDEARPKCTNCESLVIPCHGYGPKPDWMDNGEKERIVVKEMKEIIKYTSRRKAPVRSSEQSNLAIRIEPKPSTYPATTPLSGSGTGSGSSGENNGINQHLISDVHPSESETKEQYQPKPSISIEDSLDLMSFLDYVFPLQYPMYKPSISDGGRGWLMTTILQSDATYHAALALGACYRGTYANDHTTRAKTLVQQGEHLQITLGMLNRAAHNLCPQTTLSIPITMIQVFFFELFNDNPPAWTTHLEGLLNTYQCDQKASTKHGLCEEAKDILVGGLPAPEGPSVITQQVLTFRFLISSLLWLDVISSITTGRKPFLLSHHSKMLNTNSQLQLQDHMGCENWVLFQIGKISELYTWKMEAIKESRFSPVDFEFTTLTVKAQIRCSLFGHDNKHATLAAQFSGSTDPRSYITQAFAYMALVYMHVVTDDFQNRDYIETIYASAMELFRIHIPRHLLPTIVGPLFIVGMYASAEDQSFFRETFSSAPVMDPFLKHRLKIHVVLEEIWRRRDTPGFEWKDCINLTKNVMLI
ncbi:fungal-specific transcription factor domain-containing protein [Dendryphion nanum]|uniref:Fungal-specific transcription factor domain-containing protein n=1 Tax=Dendryphion nanum TaxID=256645 RepID=A0A9P9E793_9PLEO|nr:fungal-specific transcription factor domain-containing protein [Dendryphion nanum]